jgi:hypothetical protein
MQAEGGLPVMQVAQTDAIELRALRAASAIDCLVRAG